ncbi:epithelial-stromal interaction protein 1-like [Montipora capricornis]|uniref:epithelial-stromal interaction protein 1-like n=1 Tax=Montipora capricornis TaxID=246305 RepID=UPI0035F1D7D8
MSYYRDYGYSRAPMKTSRSDEGNAATGEQSGEQFGEHQIVKNDEAASKEPERKTGFTMISPDPRKRAQLEQVAKREMDEADARSEARRSRPIYERPRSVGGTASYATSIHEKQKAVRTAAHTGLQIQQKREKWQREKREAEEKEHRQRKEKARSQAERNEFLKTMRTQELEDKHREAHRRKNEAFLDRLEMANKYKY